MLNFVPLAGARWEMADHDGEVQFVGQSLEFPFPQTQAGAIASTRVCRNQQPSGLGVGFPPFRFPPRPDGGHGKGRRVVVGANIDEPSVSRQFVNAVRVGTRN